MGRRSFWSSTDENRSAFDEDMREERFLHFRFQRPCLWPLDLKVAHLV